MDYLSPIEALFPGVGSAVLAVLVESGDPLTIRQLAERAGATHPQVAHHVDRLEALGVVQRRVAGRSHLISLSEGAAAESIRGLARLRDVVLDHMRAGVTEIDPPPESVIVFGSFARGTARADSDLDIAVVAPDDCADDSRWLASLSWWLDSVAAFAGNPVAEVVLTADELRERTDEPLWEQIRREGVLVSGVPIDDLLATGARTVGTD